MEEIRGAAFVIVLCLIVGAWAIWSDYLADGAVHAAPETPPAKPKTKTRKKTSPKRTKKGTK